MGEVYRALDKKTNLLVAIKRMIVEAPTGANESALYHAQRFEEECKLLANLSIPGVPAFIESFRDGDRRVIVMEFIDGVDLEKQVMDQLALANTDISAVTAVEYAIEVAKILEHLHAHRPRPIVHRDIKPANIIVRHSDNAVYLVDFGLAREVGGGLSAKTAVGTIGYAPLEQYRGQPSTRTDQYSLGVTLHFLLTSTQPLPLQIEPLDKIKPQLPHELCWVVRKATQQQPEDRFDSVYEFRRRLEDVLPAVRAYQRELDLKAQSRDRIDLMGPTEEIDGTPAHEDLPTQRLKTNLAPVNEEPMQDFGLSHPLKNSMSLQVEFQREAVRAEAQQRTGMTQEIPTSKPHQRGYMAFFLSVILFIGVLALYYLNHSQQRQMASQVFRGQPRIEAAVGFYRSEDGVCLNRDGLGWLESLLSKPFPVNDGLKAIYTGGVKEFQFTHRSERDISVLVSVLDAQGRVLRSKWLQTEPDQRWGESPGWELHQPLSLETPLKPPAPRKLVGRVSHLNVPQDGIVLLVAAPPQSKPFRFQVEER